MSVRTVAAFAILVASPLPAHAQAWAESAGHGSVTLAVQAIENTGHIVSDGTLSPFGGSRNASVYLEVDYAITDRLSMSAGVPFVFAKYTGPAPPGRLPLQPVDQCFCWHQGLQDVGITARYNILNDAFAFTPSVSLRLPSRDYPKVGEAVVGRGLGELRLAVDGGARLDAISPHLAVQAGYSYAIVERVLDVSTNRSNLTAGLSVGLGDRWSVRATVSRQVTHGGLRAGAGPPTEVTWYPWGEITTAELYREHDRIMRDNSWHAGGGVTYSLSRADVFVSYVAFVSGTDTHDGRAVSMGVSVPFTR